MNIDIEVMCLTLGIPKTACLIETSEESLHGIMAGFIPDNQKFFLFVKDCLLGYIKKVGNRVAEERLEVSSYVLDRLMQSDEPLLTKKQKIGENITKTQEIKDNSNFTTGFKRKVVKFYHGCGDIELTASKFCVTTELVTGWLKESKNVLNKPI